MSSTEMNESVLDICQAGIFTQDQIDYRLMGNMPISIFGMLTNLINIIVFAHPEMRPSLVNHFLLALSISDLLLLVCNFFFLLFPVIAVMSTSFVLHDSYPTVLRYSYPLARTAQTCGVYLTLFVSVHRFLGVCHPFRAKRWVTGTPVKCAIFGSVLFSILINLTTWLELTVVPCYNNWFKRMSRHITLTELQKDYTYAVVMKVITYTLVMFVIPFVTLIMVNCRIIVALRRSSNLRQQHSTASASGERAERIMNQFRLLQKTKYSELFSTFMKLNNSNALRTAPNSVSAANANSVRDRSVTLMLLAIVAMFLECNGLAFCNNIVEILIFVDKIDSKSSESLFESSVEIANILVSLNSSTSILVYLIFSSKYRTIIKQFLGLEENRKVNGVALTTAMVAHRAFELSIIPDEADSRQRRNEARNKRAIFRKNTAKTQLSDSHLLLADNDGESSEERERARSASPGGPMSPKILRQSPYASPAVSAQRARQSITRSDTVA
ncbi:FMRFamide receptor [Toxocara canis]|uniref:FMRFamide receptor n=1 Tax=Toxocara canis TaxID=6265 RepID=A0A0B2UP35_TOXCA|nr:FMRFamide receptor [Toxocara canis]